MHGQISNEVEIAALKERVLLLEMALQAATDNFDRVTSILEKLAVLSHGHQVNT